MGALPRTLCPKCGRSIPVRVNGALREHRLPTRRPGHNARLCDGSGKKKAL